MISVKETELYKELIKEFNYSFGNIYVFDGFVIAEMKQGVVVNWDSHAKIMTEDVSTFLGTKGEDIIYISNRINSYSVMAYDWVKFFKNNYSLKAYCIVSENKSGLLSSMVERLFFTKKIKHFGNLYEAVNFVKKGIIEIA